MPRTMCFTFASGCSADRWMSLSFIPRTRAQSVLEVFEEDSRLTLCRLSKGDDMDAVLRLGVNDGHRNAIEQSQRHEPLLAVPETVVLVCERSAIEYPRLASTKSSPWSFRFRLRLTSSHVKPHRASVYSRCIYVKTLKQGLADLRSQFVISRWGGRRSLPAMFTGPGSRAGGSDSSR
jgi:hypothetical protein